MRRAWVCVFLFTLTFINYTDRVALSVAAKPISTEFGLSPVEMGYLLSSFLWTYVLCLLPVGLLVDRFGGKAVNAGGIALWSVATICTGLSPQFLVHGRHPHGHGHGRVDKLACLEPRHSGVVSGGRARCRQCDFRRGRSGGPGLGHGLSSPRL